MREQPKLVVQCWHCSRQVFLSDVKIERNVEDNTMADVICKKCRRKEMAGNGKS